MTPNISSISQKTALVVDDTATVLFYHRTLVEMWGFNCIDASNGQEALDILSTGKISLLLLDLHMPVMTGEEVLAQMKNRGLGPIPTVIITGESPNSTQAKRIVQTPLLKVVHKPALARQVLKAVSEVLAMNEEHLASARK